ncbi:COG1262 Uncharacterized conserved protein [Paracoccaceae bacterium]
MGVSVALAAPLAADPLDTFRDCDACPKMIELPLGEFVMGAPDDETRRILVFRDGVLQASTPENPYVKTDEGPQHRVVIDVPFAIAINEVTYSQWMACVDDGGCRGYRPPEAIGYSGSPEKIMRSLAIPEFGETKAGREIALAMEDGAFLSLSGDYPVMYISYYEAQAYVSWLNKKLGTDAYRLPTEAEWEYAARAGTQTPYWSGDDISPWQANFSGDLTDTVLMGDFPELLTRGFPLAVTELEAANPWGIRHIVGNVSEITVSCYTKELPDFSTLTAWIAESPRDCDQVVQRGGSYDSAIENLRSAYREKIYILDRWPGVGFRVVKKLN